jgi:Carboxypeptidase regulatory-like domain
MAPRGNYNRIFRWHARSRSDRHHQRLLNFGEFSGANVIFLKARIGRSTIRRLNIGFSAIFAIVLAISAGAAAQTAQTPEVQLGQIIGTAIDVRGDAVAGATATLTGPEPSQLKTAVTGENGFFQFNDVNPGGPYQVVITASGFADWTSPAITLKPGEVKLLGGIPLNLATQTATVQVTANSVEVATEQFKTEETQRILGFIPNFYVAYEGDNTAPLTTKMKFKLALKVSYDPITIGAIALFAGLRQASDSPNYVQGAKGYGERFGATAADGFTDIMIGGAILPSLLHQDPRYFYQGTGTTRSRLRHALLGPFIAKGDNGKWQPNYSSMGGDLGSAAISNLYYPESNRGVGLVFSSFAIGTAERIGADVAQEFLLSKFTYRRAQQK